MIIDKVLSNFSKLTQKSMRSKNSTELEVLTYFSEKYVGTSSFDLLFEIAK